MPDQVFSNEPEVVFDPGSDTIVEVIFSDGEHVIEVIQDSEAQIDVVGEGLQGPPGPGIPRGGVPGQYPAKRSGTDYDLQWNYFPYVLLEPGGAPDPATTPYGALVVEMAD